MINCKRVIGLSFIRFLITPKNMPSNINMALI